MSTYPNAVDEPTVAPPVDLKREKDVEASVSDASVEATANGLKPAFYAKVQVLNKALNDMGMGRYQWELFFTSGFGWFADNLWLQAIAIVQPAVANEFVPYPYARWSTLALYAGLIVGATFWGMSCDVIGRRLAWNCTLLIAGIFGVAVGGAPNWIAFCALIACVGFGAGGNLPVDGTMFLGEPGKVLSDSEFLPGNKQYLLTFLSVWWAVGQVVGSLIAWVFLAHYGCQTREFKSSCIELVAPEGERCSRESNMGWRYTYFTLGAMILFLWVIRYFLLPVYESPKFLASIGRDEEAVAVIHQIAKRNGVSVNLTLEDLQAAAAPYLDKDQPPETKFTKLQLVRNSFSELGANQLRPLFCTPRLALSTSMVIYCYAALGLAYPLYNGFLGGYLQSKNSDLGDESLDATYSAYTYQAACGVPGSILAAFLVNWSRGGRKFAMAFFTVMAGVFLFVTTQAKNQVQLNALVSLAAFWENAFYGVLYGYAPEVFPTPSRGTGDALAAAASRITGIFAPVIAVYAKSADGPVFTAAAIFVVTGFIMLFLPIETAGKNAL